MDVIAPGNMGNYWGNFGYPRYGGEKGIFNKSNYWSHLLQLDASKGSSFSDGQVAKYGLFGCRLAPRRTLPHQGGEDQWQGHHQVHVRVHDKP